MKRLITCPQDLLGRLQLTAEQVSIDLNQSFPLRVSEHFVAQMRPNDPNDPLLLQVLPQTIESQITQGFEADPLQEKLVNPLPGLLHKFRSRILLTLTSACPVHCRFCFRRHFPYGDNQITPNDLDKIIDYIQQDPSIKEIIFSGGDPLVLPDRKLLKILTKLSSIKHIKIIRFHTRMPIMIPARINSDLIATLKQTRFQFVFVYHVNHPNELCDDIKHGVSRLMAQGITVLSQTVLLKGINDDASTLTKLCWQLFQCGIIPYYVHLLDKVSGSAHFLTSEQTARKLQQHLQAHLPGYLTPQFVQEIPKATSKVKLT